MLRSRRSALGYAAQAATAGLVAACSRASVAALERAVPSPSPRPSAVPTPATLLRPPLTYVAIGASDTAGVGVEDPEREAWVNVLAQALPQPVRVVNLGISGATARQAVDDELPQALDVLEGMPGLVTV